AFPNPNAPASSIRFTVFWERSSRGRGWGLSIADTLAKKYGGHLELTDSRRFGHGLLIRALLDKETLK
ncbi:ATP-binding protein, partial [Klebsiella pneumoniae]|nr:ATP-binding protein [Klebsiella pneumoniae]